MAAHRSSHSPCPNAKILSVLYLAFFWYGSSAEPATVVDHTDFNVFKEYIGIVNSGALKVEFVFFISDGYNLDSLPSEITQLTFCEDARGRWFSNFCTNRQVTYVDCLLCSFVADAGHTRPTRQIIPLAAAGVGGLFGWLMNRNDISELRQNDQTIMDNMKQYGYDILKLDDRILTLVQLEKMDRSAIQTLSQNLQRLKMEELKNLRLIQGNFDNVETQLHHLAEALIKQSFLQKYELHRHAFESNVREERKAIADAVRNQQIDPKLVDNTEVFRKLGNISNAFKEKYNIHLHFGSSSSEANILAAFKVTAVNTTTAMNGTVVEAETIAYADGSQYKLFRLSSYPVPYSSNSSQQLFKKVKLSRSYIAVNELTKNYYFPGMSNLQKIGPNCFVSIIPVFAQNHNNAPSCESSAALSDSKFIGLCGIQLSSVPSNSVLGAYAINVSHWLLSGKSTELRYNCPPLNEAIEIQINGSSFFKPMCGCHYRDNEATIFPVTYEMCITEKFFVTVPRQYPTDQQTADAIISAMSLLSQDPSKLSTIKPLDYKTAIDEAITQQSGFFTDKTIDRLANDILHDKQLTQNRLNEMLFSFSPSSSTLLIAFCIVGVMVLVLLAAVVHLTFKIC